MGTSVTSPVCICLVKSVYSLLESVPTRAHNTYATPSPRGTFDLDSLRRLHYTTDLTHDFPYSLVVFYPFHNVRSLSETSPGGPRSANTPTTGTSSSSNDSILHPFPSSTVFGSMFPERDDLSESKGVSTPSRYFPCTPPVYIKICIHLFLNPLSELALLTHDDVRCHLSRISLDKRVYGSLYHFRP